ncbi:hypothetical protein A7L45_13605 [Clostridium estertheticum subsp. estertheticum]|uniref:Uncharacterized protein n=2 Tax=Clostridium estertheticum TaxID=238834 RepID=A0A1J0GI83_9CLOT|nr:hypothetical protein A7L45_13605 [Clostridium estertheticum subsp. estertheticum]
MTDNNLFFIQLNKILQVFVDDPFENMKLAYDIQMSLLDRILKIENEIKSNKGKITRNKGITKDKNTTNDTRRKLSTESKNLKDESINLKEDIKRLREIGDSLAFAYFNKHDLKTLCWKQTAGFIGGKEGLKKELYELKSIFESGRFAILNDITNSLRYGDITIEKEGKPYLLEIKSSDNRNNRIIRQEKGLDEKMEVIQNDYIENFEETNQTFKRVHTNKQEINYKEDLQLLIEEAFLKGKIIKEMEEGLTYAIYYKLEDFDSFKEVCQNINEPRVFYINQMKYINENYTPFPIIFKDEKSLMEFYNGNLIILVVIDLKVLRNKLKQKGYIFNHNENGEFTITFEHDGEDIDMVASNYHVTRIGREFISLEWFINGIEDVVNSVSS